VSFPAPQFVEANGIRLAVYEAGERSDKPPVVLVHGFPEIAYSWRHQIPVLAEAGFHVLAPDMRGYGHSDCPDAIEAYDMAHLTGDLCGLLTAFGHDKGIFCGHDWGGLVTWAMPVFHPERVAANIGVNTPFQPRGPLDPITLFEKTFGAKMYIVQFQTVGPVDDKLNAAPEQVIRFFHRKTWIKREEYEQRDRSNLDLLGAFDRGEDKWPGDLLLNTDELAVYTKAFERTGFTPGINWYRNMRRNWELAEGLPQTVSTPCLQICAEDDISLPPRLAEPMKEVCADLEMHLIEDCGHWTMAEKTDELNAILLDWLKRRF